MNATRIIGTAALISTGGLALGLVEHGRSEPSTAPAGDAIDKYSLPVLGTLGAVGFGALANAPKTGPGMAALFTGFGIVSAAAAVSGALELGD